MKKLTIILLASIYVLFLTSCKKLNSKNFNKTNGTTKIEINKPKIDTLIAIAIWKQPSAHGQVSRVDIEFTDSVSAKFTDKLLGLDNMKFNSPLYVDLLDSCVIQYEKKGHTFIKNLTKSRLHAKYSK